MIGLHFAIELNVECYQADISEHKIIDCYFITRQPDRYGFLFFYCVLQRLTICCASFMNSILFYRPIY